MISAGSMADALKDEAAGNYDFTRNGQCSKCGQCCSNILPMSEAEIRLIRKYVKKHHIKEQTHKVAPLAKPVIADLTCPFLDDSKATDKCTIYPQRPLICRKYICSKQADEMARDIEFFTERRKAVDVRRTFFGDCKL